MLKQLTLFILFLISSTSVFSQHVKEWERQQIMFDKTMKVRYFRLTSLKGIRDMQFSSITEIGVIL